MKLFSCSVRVHWSSSRPNDSTQYGVWQRFLWSWVSAKLNKLPICVFAQTLCEHGGLSVSCEILISFPLPSVSVSLEITPSENRVEF